jgi:hypothetical protein
MPAVSIPPGHPWAFTAFPNAGAIVEIFQPRGGDFDVFHHGDWTLVDYNMADFAGKDTEFVCKWLDTHSL